MEIRETLKEAHFVNERIAFRIRRIEELNEGYRLFEDNLTEEQKAVARTNIDLVCAAYTKELLELCDIEYSVIGIIQKINSPLGKRIYELRYLEDKSWAMVARELSYSQRYIQGIHDKILRELEESIK